MVAAIVSETLLAFGRGDEAEDRALGLIDAVLAPGTPLAIAPPQRFVVDHGDHSRTWSCRAVCCLYTRPTTIAAPSAPSLAREIG